MNKKHWLSVTVGCLLMLSFFSSTLWAVEENGLVLHYDFGEGSGNIVKDKSGNGNDGTIHGAQWMAQGNGYALNFDGVDDWVNVPGSGSLSSMKKGTVELWYNISKDAGFPGIMTIKPSGANFTDMPLMLFVRNDEKVFAYVSDRKKYTSAAVNAVREQWAHFAVTWDGARIKAYGNGVLGSNNPCAYGPVIADQPLWIGRVTYGGSGVTPYFKGCLGEVAIYNKALDEAAIVQHYKSGVARFSSAPSVPELSGPVLRYDFDEGVGLVAKDKSGNGLDGKIIGAKYVRKDKGYALEFDGKSCVQVAKSEVLNKLGKPGMSYTIELRFKTPGRKDQALTEKWPNSSVPYPWAIRGPYPDGAVKFAVYDAKNNKSSGASYTHPATKDDKWHHLAAVRDMESGYLLLYIDGVLGQKGRDALTKTDLSNDGQVCLGARTYSTHVGYGAIVGQLDDVRIYDRALTAAEVKQHCGLAELPVHRDIQSADTVEKYQPVKPAMTLRAGEMTVKADARGAVQIDAGSDSYIVESCFSYPGPDNKIGWNGLPRAFDQPSYPVVEFQKGAESEWKPVVKQVSADTISLAVKGKHYSIQRTIKVRNGKVDFEDELTNLSATPTGVVVRHGITANSDFLERYNGGLEVAANPTVFLKGPKRSAAMVMNDDFSRRRIRSAFGSSLNHSGVQLLRFALDAGKTYTFSWSVYVMEKGRGSYFDFINRLRNDWNANFAIDGPYTFGALKPEGDDIKFYIPFSSKVFYVNQVLKDPSNLQKYLKWRGTKMFSTAPWLHHDPGAMDHAVTREEYIKIMKRFVPFMHKVAPQVKVLASIETDWVSFRRENIKDSHRIPIADRSKRGGPSLVVMLDPDVSQLIVDSRPSWKDSFVYDAQGRLKIYTYYRGGKAIEQPPVCVFPEVGNARYAHLFDHIKLCIDELGFDGVYLDEFPLGQNGSRRTYRGEWDGLSADVSFHTGRISGQYKDCSLAGVQARVNLMNYVHSKDKIFVANRHSTTLAEQSIPAFRFTETGGDVAEVGKTWQVGTKPPMRNYLCWSHLNTPLGLGACGGPAGNEAQWLMKVTIIYLRHGMVFYHYNMTEPPMTEENKDAFDIMKHMFPITPIELGEGFIIGKERILTAVSMDRLWEKKGKPTVMLLDINGRRVDLADRCEVKPEKGKWRVTLKLNDWAEVAVVE